MITEEEFEALLNKRREESLNKARLLYTPISLERIKADCANWYPMFNPEAKIAMEWLIAQLEARE